MVDSIRKDGFGHIQIDPETDGDDTRKEEDLSEEIQEPVLSKAACYDDENGEDTHEDE
jgi:hypothetical protein